MENEFRRNDIAYLEDRNGVKRLLECFENTSRFLLSGLSRRKLYRYVNSVKGSIERYRMRDVVDDEDER